MEGRGGGARVGRVVSMLRQSDGGAACCLLAPWLQCTLLQCATAWRLSAAMCNSLAPQCCLCTAWHMAPHAVCCFLCTACSTAHMPHSCAFTQPGITALRAAAVFQRATPCYLSRHVQARRAWSMPLAAAAAPAQSTLPPSARWPAPTRHGSGMRCPP